MATSSDWQRLGELVSERRGDLGLTQEDLRAAGGPSTATQRLIEGGHQSRYQPTILARLETALGWQRGSVRRILAGGDPVIVRDEPDLLATTPEPDTPADDDRTSVIVLAAISGSPIERGIWRQIGEGIPFSDPFERALWGREFVPEDQRVREIAAYRSVQARPTPARWRRAG